MTEALQSTLGKFSIDGGQREELNRFYLRLEEGKPTRDENPHSHFCVFFAAYDPKLQEVFIGHHKKSGLWLFNGGHIDMGESPEEALQREIAEEWGVGVDLPEPIVPKLLTITDIDNPSKQTCTLHYDIWYFVPMSKNDFSPRQDLLDQEFHQSGWFKIEDARGLEVSKPVLEALEFIENELL